MVRTTIVAVLLIGAGLAGSACATYTSTARERAEQLVKDARPTGIAPELTVDVAMSVNGADAPQICGVLAHDPVNITTWSRVQRGVPEEKVRDLVAYDELVVKIYCPEQTDRFMELLNALNIDP